MEKLQKDASQPLDLKQHQENVGAAIQDAQKEDQGSTQSNSDSNMEFAGAVGLHMAASMFFPEYKAAVIPMAAVIAHAAYEALSSGQRKTVTHKSKSEKKTIADSKYAYGMTGKTADQNQGASLVPLSYSDKKHLAKSDKLRKNHKLFADINNSSMSTTGEGCADGKKVRSKGTKLDGPSAKKLSVYLELMREYGLTKKLQGDPDADYGRLVARVEDNNPNAIARVIQSPELHNKFQQLGR